MRLFFCVLMVVVQGSPLVTTVLAAETHAASTIDWYAPCLDGQNFRFSSGFEDLSQVRADSDGEVTTRLQKTGKYDPCKGKDDTKATQGVRPGKATIHFEGGTDRERRAQVTVVPDDPTNHALQFWLQKPYILGTKNFPVKGRIQMNVYGIQGIRQLKMSVRMYLHPDFNLVRSFPGSIDWLTISEWWNNASWTPGAEYPFRISVNLVKEFAGENAPLYFQVHAQTFDTDRKRWDGEVWTQVNRAFIVPIGRWVTLDYGFIEGGAETGRFFLSATFQGGKRTVIFDEKGYTHHPADPKPDGISEFNPMKLYTSSRIIDYVASEGGALQILWDDFQLTACRGEDRQSLSPCTFQ